MSKRNVYEGAGKTFVSLCIKLYIPVKLKTWVYLCVACFKKIANKVVQILLS
jgi:hypothetical protein